MDKTASIDRFINGNGRRVNFGAPLLYFTFPFWTFLFYRKHFCKSEL
ncbi:hypothetical protein LEP1GSC133_1870 [Leptospira borgpetersenii serovar Pomona str. 200901868]|uniref:Uncharacterized protein n=4 Tax=Leptospira borgpetersenii TaxID=174 RepID=M3HU32_LEPBO|nr:hypothetical protein LBBP_01761 [Leptospira borgpetersenii serovar Ballum]EKP13098.1 hypothetical protein LEP1GSC128_3195 [Leptospira borgpetersenii str. 200801926]EKR01781.1 hypothetical protein LEP1GSC121_4123 [Leptospira borgpetersenii serovar Castellonis str. 200801910]EMG01536.1 hypothetical protein LEP1GSC123_4512 [Leptospira borgpetersenii str. 200701203]EMO10212.1 hypothetical protein LEP1GSC137_0679 [Leptospira borgpetersenii str. Noumea 25]EMO62397.1 hypothetical protein LEP1GSC13